MATLSMTGTEASYSVGWSASDSSSLNDSSTLASMRGLAPARDTSASWRMLCTANTAPTAHTAARNAAASATP